MPLVENMRQNGTLQLRIEKMYEWVHGAGLGMAIGLTNMGFFRSVRYDHRPGDLEAEISAWDALSDEALLNFEDQLD